MAKTVEIDYHFGRKSAFDNAQSIISSNNILHFTVFVDCFNGKGVIAEFDHLVNANKVKAELMAKFANISDGSYTTMFKKMIDEKRDQAKGPFFLILLKTLDIPL